MNIPDDPVIQELIEEFVETWLEDINKFSGYIEEKNADDLYRLGHTIKGSCLQFGLDDIAELGIELMGHCKENNFEEAAKYEDQIRNKFKEVKEYLDSQK